MRTAAYILILASLLMAPVKRLNVAHLEPVEVIQLYAEGNTVCLRTDTGAMGRGGSVLAALKDMEASTAGVIYLKTAEYLLVEKETIQYINDLRGKLNRKIRVCATENADIKVAAEYLETHGKLPRLRDWEPGEMLPIWDGKKIY